MNVLNQERLFHGVRFDVDMKPLIIFTSGQHVPQEKWMPLDHPMISSKVITMRADKEAIDQLKAAYKYNREEPKTEDLLKLTQKYGLLVECLHKCENLAAISGKVCNFEATREIVYEFTNVSTLGNGYKFLWLLWPHVAGLRSEEAIVEGLRDCKIEPWRIVALGLHLPQSRNRQDIGINTILNWLDVSKGKEQEDAKEQEDVEEQEDLYSSYYGSAYVYHFPHLDIVRPILVSAFKGCTVRKMYACYLELYKKLEHSISSNLQSVKGLLFGNLINLASHCSDKPQGVGVIGSVARLIPVKEVCYPSTVNELCEHTTRFFSDNSVGSMWCILNVLQKPHFEGYDFAFVEAKVNGDRTIQLLQVTVNADTDSTEYMELVSGKVHVKDKLKALGVQVTPYFIVPDILFHVEVSHGYQVITFSLP